MCISWFLGFEVFFILGTFFFKIILLLWVKEKFLLRLASGVSLLEIGFCLLSLEGSFFEVMDFKKCPHMWECHFTF